MERLFIECTVRAVLLVGGTALVLYAMRVKPAALKHGIWTGVVASMLLLPIWTVWGPKASLRVLPPFSQTSANEAIITAPAYSTALLPSSPILMLRAIMLGVYLLGLSLLLLRLAMGTVRASQLVRDAVLQDGKRISSTCAAPVTVGFLRPTVILPEHWRQWPQAQLDAVMAHELEHARRRDSLVQWVALLNRALFWFHPVAWWLECHLSALAEEVCDNAVLARGHSPHEYAGYLIDMARSVTRSGTRLNITGMAMPGSFLPQRVRQIMAGTPIPRISRTRIACVATACAFTCTLIAAGTLDHVRQNVSARSQRDPSGGLPATKFVLGDIKIEGDIHDREGVRNRILKAWRNREYDDDQKLVDDVFMEGIRVDFQDRGYFKIFAHDPIWHPLGIRGGKERILVIAPLEEGEQYRLSSFSIQSVPTERMLSISSTTLREQFHLRNGDLFNVTEIREGLERMRQLYGTIGYSDVRTKPDAKVDDASHRIDLILRITEGPHTP